MGDKWIERFRHEALPRIIKEFMPEKVLLFGSRVTGEATRDSDLDVIIIASAFKDVPFIRRMKKVLEAAKFPKHVDYLCYTREEFERVKGSSAIIQEALEHHVEVGP
jgi:predicted nucleotidyltransferase